jgi:hypothetical protein
MQIIVGICIAAIFYDTVDYHYHSILDDTAVDSADAPSSSRTITIHVECIT